MESKCQQNTKGIHKLVETKTYEHERGRYYFEEELKVCIFCGKVEYEPKTS